MVTFFHIEVEILYKAVLKMLLNSFMYSTKKKRHFPDRNSILVLKRIKPPAFSVKNNVTF